MGIGRRIGFKGLFSAEMNNESSFSGGNFTFSVQNTGYVVLQRVNGFADL
jgi:hypothetical protein